ncbi:hypothetical protein [Streptomyces sp. S.PB5]|uniref:hypothetical protein n=1 Tax=Streptomyces sp. S.PB5 TaxID=3020844 RepID=UPI0025B15004|nr:hypothetical protein [Streptomyces sp. S.PB5]MDN3029237.1 hypothetical protein [Streptomyces sp. S.PB5]
MIVRTRVLAEAPGRVWIAVGGTLGLATEPRLRQELRACDDGQRTEFFLDLTELRYKDELSDDTLRGLFALDHDVRFHLIGAPAEIRRRVAGDPRFTSHHGVESAWAVWT